MADHTKPYPTIKYIEPAEVMLRFISSLGSDLHWSEPEQETGPNPLGPLPPRPGRQRVPG